MKKSKIILGAYSAIALLMVFSSVKNQSYSAEKGEHRNIRGNSPEYKDLQAKAENLVSYLKSYKLHFGKNPNDIFKFLGYVNDKDKKGVESFSFRNQHGIKDFSFTPFYLHESRVDGSPIGGPKVKNSFDVIASSRFFAKKEGCLRIFPDNIRGLLDS